MENNGNTPTPAPAPVKAGRILLVEDEPTNMAILSAYLNSATYDVVEAVDGQMAWEILVEDTSFDVVVTDRRMPRKDGLELANLIKKTKEIKHIPVIMQTGATAQEEVSEGIRAGVYYYLAKPYEEGTLLAIVRAALAEKRKNQMFNQKLDKQKDALDLLNHGEFHIKTLAEAENLALMLGSVFSRPELAVNGLYELLVNSIEHGNLGIGYDLKSQLVSEGNWAEVVNERQSSPQYKDKKVVVQFARQPTRMEIVIQDEGVGFDPQPFMEIEPSRATQNHGRGIAKANLLSFDSVTYEGYGSRVRIVSS